MRDLFTKNVVEHDFFRSKILCKLPPAKSHEFSTNSLKLKGSLFLNSLSDEIKSLQSLTILNTHILDWDSFPVQHLQKLIIGVLVLFYFYLTLFSIVN